MIKLVNVYREPTAERFLYELLRERSTEDDPNVNISHRALPTWQQHRRFMRSRPYRAWYLIKMPVGGFCGYVSLTRRNEIGIVVEREHRGMGFGKQAVQAIIARHKPLPGIASERRGSFLANINPMNASSIAMFSGLGFKHIQNTYAL